ncbi:hypothetical protein BDP27DRAFT_1335557 [Rhodocollybia butyracea]|uniref:DUF6593 domain-containing protein n=1 Tax=Rhodocollybia butyracea TaxID=206335 RepID=A0A9P5U1Q7_9AGAR|nr:hypothetical protein BDP27DRAFT_1335557 [Rhodocollybia butyracea]
MSVNFYQLHGTFGDVINNTYCNPHGATVYTVHTSSVLTPTRTTTISKALHDSLPEPPRREPGISLADDSPTPLASGTSDALHNSDVDADPSTPEPTSPRRGTGVRTNLAYIAQIEWGVFKSSKLRFGIGRYSGREVLVEEFFRKQGFGFWGRDRVFTGEDGKEYKWRLRATYAGLTLNNGSDTLIAVFHPKWPLFTKDGGRLEIFPRGQHMVDEIFVTFTYVERIRKARHLPSSASFPGPGT